MRSGVYADMNGCGRPPHKSSFTVLELPTSYHPEDMVRGVPKANRNDLEFKLIYVRQLYRAGMDTRTGSKARARRKPHNPKIQRHNYNYLMKVTHDRIRTQVLWTMLKSFTTTQPIAHSEA